ncbi:S1C family serine protease [Micrococcoides hystricis]|uniref:S1C family serine protease n=1 Tax=Micrococcoides hystricis TaxID=1572761 RepID=A0ABV6P888_9MICC
MSENNNPNTEPFDRSHQHDPASKTPPSHNPDLGPQHTQPLPRYGAPTEQESAWGQRSGEYQYGHHQPETVQHHQYQQNRNGDSPQSGKRYGVGMVVGSALLAGLIGGIGGAGVATVISNQNATGSLGSQPQTLNINNPESVTPVTAAAAKAAPSVVTISVVQGRNSGSGSGVVIDDEGHILTNNHVVTLGGQADSPQIQVKSADGKVYNATLIGRDSYSDLAVLKVEDADLPAIEMAESANLNVGDGAIAIGAPLGLDGTVTDGIISRLNRTISVQSAALPGEDGSDPEESGPNHFDFRIPGVETPHSRGSIAINVIQTDAAINQGNSGGALLDGQGRLIGINVAIASSGQSESAGNIGVGFAIPIDYAKRIAEDIIQHGEASHGLLGVTVRPKAPQSADTSSHFSVGAEVVQSISGGPADKAGLRSGDVITAVGDRRVEDALTLNAAVREYRAGDEAEVRYLRNGQERTANVTLADLADQ